jgi:hypothetical protein
VHQELRLYQQLQAIYEVVAGASDDGPKEVRRRSMLEFRRLFAGTYHRIEGLEHLPERPGHTVIMNHLRNHLDNLLPNNFILTLDTYFVASMILFERYGQAPIRVIRKSRPDEYGHQRFYDRLGYVYAYSGAMWTPATRIPAAPRRRAAASSWTRPAPTCGWARTW